MSSKPKVSNKIEMLDASKLIPYARNSRTHSDEQVQQIAASIREFGFTNPILISETDDIIAGHGRLLAAQLLKIKKVPCIRLDHLTEAQRRAYVIADNKLALNAGWDDEILRLELAELNDLEFDLSITGFSDEELAALTPEQLEEGLTDEDAVPEAPETPKTVEGDIWILGRHRLMCGDSTAITAVDLLMNGVRANICFTSPPYNAGSLNVSGNERTQKKYNLFDDNQSPDEFFDFLTSNLDCMMAVCDEVFYNVGLVQNNKKVIFNVISHYGDKFKDMIYWRKKTVAPHIQKGVINNLVEFIMCFGDGKRKFLNPQFGQGSYYNVIEGGNATGNEYSDIHKATFPVYLPENIINNFTSRNAIVVDCFGGTGTTLIACEKTNRNAYLMEIDPKYCDVMIRRWQDFTGQKAKHAVAGLTFDEMSKDRKGPTG